MTRFVFYQKLPGNCEEVKWERKKGLLPWSMFCFHSWRKRGGGWGEPIGPKSLDLAPGSYWGGAARMTPGLQWGAGT